MSDEEAAQHFAAICSSSNIMPYVTQVGTSEISGRIFCVIADAVTNSLLITRQHVVGVCLL